ncbi:MAG TPA: HNH endonuclease [Chitinophagales bacterium]|nr:HNH endonuclease [Chitinophagales bacterium]
MRKIDKPARPIPQPLQDCFSHQQSKLLQQKERHQFANACYNTAIKADLNRYYHNKCAFCETSLTDNKGANQFTVEHFRPKTHYFWLGYEWTNLMPTCWTCNNHKENKFQILDKRKKATLPLLPCGNLNLDECNAHCQNLLAENADLLHPEIEDPMDFLQFSKEKIGFFVEGTTAHRRANYTINLCKLNRTALAIEQRKKIYDTVLASIEAQMLLLLEKFPNKREQDARLLAVAFENTFNSLYKQDSLKTEYTCFRQFLLAHFDQLFIAKMPNRVSQEVLTKAFIAFAKKI